MVQVEVSNEVYQRLEEQRQEDESISDVVERLLSEREHDWREGFGTLSEKDPEQLQKLVATQRDALSKSLFRRQKEAIEQMNERTDT